MKNSCALRASMPEIRIALLIDAYAQTCYLHQWRRLTRADSVQAWRDPGLEYFPLPHPGPRNRLWFRRHPWFEQTVQPALRERVKAALARDEGGATRSNNDARHLNPYETDYFAHQSLRP